MPLALAGRPETAYPWEFRRPRAAGGTPRTKGPRPRHSRYRTSRSMDRYRNEIAATRWSAPPLRPIAAIRTAACPGRAPSPDGAAAFRAATRSSDGDCRFRRPECARATVQARATPCETPSRHPPAARCRSGGRRPDASCARRVQRLAEIGEDIVDVLDANRQPHIAGRHTGRRLFRFGQLRVRRAGRMDRQAACVTNVGDVIEQLQRSDEFRAGIDPAGEFETDQTAHAFRQIFRGALRADTG